MSEALGKCRVCPAPIRWVVVASTGKRLPLDPTPRPLDGNVYLDHEGKAVVVGKAAKARLLAAWAPQSPPGFVWYVAHFATCPGKRVTSKA